MGNVESLAVRGENILALAAAWPIFQSLDELTRVAIEQVTADHGIDFATALIFERLCKAEPHASAIAGIEAIEFESAHHRGDTMEHERPLQLGIVPGAFYVEKPCTGADGRVIREEAERLGIGTALIPTRSFGSLDENAAIIREWLSRQRSTQTVLVSLSKGGADVKWALHKCRDDDAIQQLAGWINVSGITEGSPLVAWLLRRQLRSWIVRMLFWWRKYDFDVVRELDFGRDEPLGCNWNIPQECPTVHVVGFPLQKQLSSGLMRRGHRRLTGLGPSDGAGILLLEATQRPGVVFPIWGVDHYLHPNEDDLRILFRKLLLYVAQQRRILRDERVAHGASP